MDYPRDGIIIPSPLFHHSLVPSILCIRQSEGENSNDSKVDNSDASSNSKFEFENVTNEDVGDVKGSKYMDD
jgi:hypothetical protein